MPIKLGQLIDELVSLRSILTAMGKDADEIEVFVHGERGEPHKVIARWRDGGKLREFVQLL